MLEGKLKPGGVGSKLVNKYCQFVSEMEKNEISVEFLWKYLGKYKPNWGLCGGTRSI